MSHHNEEQDVEPKLVTYSTFAAMISCCENYVKNLAAQGVIPTVKMGRRCVRIPVKRALAKLEELEVSRG